MFRETHSTPSQADTGMRSNRPAAKLRARDGTLKIPIQLRLRGVTRMDTLSCVKRCKWGTSWTASRSRQTKHALRPYELIACEQARELPSSSLAMYGVQFSAAFAPCFSN